MTRSSTKELFTPFKDPKHKFQSSRKLFKTLSLDKSRSHEFNLFFDLEENSEEEVAKTMAGSDHKDVNEHIEKVLEIVDLFHVPNITQDQKVILFYNGLEVPTRQILDSKGDIPTKKLPMKKIAIQEMEEYSQKWHNGTSRTRSTKTFDGLATIQAQLNNLRIEIKKVNEKVYAAQVGCVYSSPGYGVLDFVSSWFLVKCRHRITVSSLIDTAYRMSEQSELVERKENRVGEELIQESTKKQNIEDDKEIAELNQLMEIIQDKEEVAIVDIPLAVKSPRIVDWKIHKEGKKSYYQIVKADGKTRMYMVFSKMLESFNKEDLKDLYKLKIKYGIATRIQSVELEVVVNMDGYRDQDIGDVIFEEPFYKASCVEAKRFNGLIIIHNGNDDVTYQMARSNLRNYMTRSSTKELFTPFKDPERKFRSSRKLFKTLSLDKSRSPEFNLFFDLEENSDKEVARTMANCMTRSSTKELFTPFKDPECKFRSSRKLFKTLSLDKSRSPEFNLFFDLEENSEKEVARTMA
nr:hypothetical protein [Tanacetum cinerariifolium]